MEAPVKSFEGNSVCSLSFVADLLCFAEIVTKWFLDQYMFAFIKTSDGPFVMQPVWKRNVDSIDIRIRDQLIVGGIRFCVLNPILVYLCLGFGQRSGRDSGQNSPRMRFNWINYRTVIDVGCSENSYPDGICFFGYGGFLFCNPIPPVVSSQYVLATNFSSLS